MSEWQPIETAPKDEAVRFLVYSEAEGVCTVKRDWRGDFVLDPDGGTEFMYEFYHPFTHWMPMPAPPVENAA